MTFQKVKTSIIFLFLLLFIIGCSESREGLHENPEEDDGITLLDVGSTPIRKIIYKAELTIYTTSLLQTIDAIYLLKEADEWFDYESISQTSATFILRVKTERLDDVLNTLKTEHNVRSSQKVGRDISLDYQDKTDKIAALVIQRDRLLELYEDATLTEMITINQQLSNIEIQIAQLQGTLNEFDSLVDYSELKIYIYQSTIATRSPFFPRIALAFENGLKAVVNILDGLAIGIVTLLPIAVVFVPAGYGIFKLNKAIKKRIKTKKESETPKEK